MAAAVQDRTLPPGASAASDAAATPAVPASPPEPEAVSEGAAAGESMPAMPAIPANVAMLRPTRWHRIHVWLRMAYTDVGSKEHAALLEYVIWMVIVSVVVTVLQHDHALDREYH